MKRSSTEPKPLRSQVIVQIIANLNLEPPTPQRKDIFSHAGNFVSR